MRVEVHEIGVVQFGSVILIAIVRASDERFSEILKPPSNEAGAITFTFCVDAISYFLFTCEVLSLCLILPYTGFTYIDIGTLELLILKINSLF